MASRLPHGSADQPDQRPQRSLLRANVLALTALVIVGGALLWWQQDPPAGDAGAAAYPADAVRRLDHQLQAMSGSAGGAEFVETAGGGDTARTVAAALTDLGAVSATFSYVDGGQAPARPDGATAVSTRITWRADGSVLPATEQQTSAVLLFGYDGERFVLAGAEPEGEHPFPLWLMRAVRVEQAPGVAVVAVGDDAAGGRLLDQARAAASAVRSTVTLPLQERLVVVAPDTRDGFSQLVGGSRDQAAAVAAVTTRLGADRQHGAVVVVNPGVFAEMDARAQQIVMTHEAVHQLTDAVGSPGLDTMWVVEGFADWVALRDDAAGLEASAGRIAAQVRQEGAPQRLPRREDFADAGRVTAVYESAWLAVRMLVEQHGAEAVTRFYAQVAGGDARSVDAVLRATLGTEEAAVTRQWQDYLTYIASTVS